MRSDPPFPANVSPINLLTASFPPTFVVVATADWLIPPSESYSAVEKLKELGVEATYADAVGMGHGVCEDPRASWPEGQRWWEEAVEPSLEWAEKKLRA
jgi:acetyl esterase/lipase